MNRACARFTRVALVAGLLVMLPTLTTRAADPWIEVKSPNFTLVSDAGERSTRTLAWQLEQVRGAMAALWTWARVDLNKPLAVIGLRDENSMKAMAPRYWEEKGAIRPASVWVTAPDQHYLAIRTDVRVEDRGAINPHISAYFSYIGLILTQSGGRELPLWFRIGFTGVLSNTIVRDDHILFGAPIPWELERLRDRPPMPLAKLVAITRESREFTQADNRNFFDAQTWAFVHFLMFGENGVRAGKLDQFAKLVSSSTDAAWALRETLGPLEALDGPLHNYVHRGVYSYRRVNLDVSVERERFPVRTLPAAESAAVRASFHAAMRRPVEARAAIAEARKADPNVAGSYGAEALLFDAETKSDEARIAYATAVEKGSTNAYAYYRLAALTWQPNPSREVLVEIEKRLSRAIELNSRYAAAYAWLGELRSTLGTPPDPIGLIRRAISLEPLEADYRRRAARVLLRQEKYAEARVEAQAALTLADSDADRKEAQDLLDLIEKSTKSPKSSPVPTPGRL